MSRLAGTSGGVPLASPAGVVTVIVGICLIALVIYFRLKK
jgi:hypothetical protein